MAETMPSLSFLYVSQDVRVCTSNKAKSSIPPAQGLYCNDPNVVAVSWNQSCVCVRSRPICFLSAAHQKGRLAMAVSDASLLEPVLGPLLW